MTTYSRPRPRTSVADTACRQLKEMIIRGEIGHASSISEADLAARLGVSRTPLREALRELEAQRFVCRLPNGRLDLVAMSTKEVTDLYQVRSVLEGLVVESATQELTDDWAARLAELQRAHEVLATAGLLSEASTQGDAFHYALIQLADNEVASGVLSRIRDRLRTYRQIVNEENPGRALTAAAEHRQVLEMMLARRPEDAGRMMRQHINDGTRTLVSALDRRLAALG